MKPIIFLCSLLILFSCSSPNTRKESLHLSSNISELVDGWDDMISFIRDNLEKKSLLATKRFPLHIKLSGDWGLDIRPQDAFAITKLSSNRLEAQIVDPDLLVEKRGGLSKMTFVGARLSKVGGDGGSISISPSLSCMYEVSFYQRDKLVNFPELKQAYEYDVVFQGSEILELYGERDTSLLFKRKSGGNYSETSVYLLLRDKVTGEQFVTSPVIVPPCMKAPPSKTDALLIPRRPDQCVRHMGTEGSPVMKGIDREAQLGERLYNECQFPIRCKMLARYGYVKKSKLVAAQFKEYAFILPPFKEMSVNTSWKYDKTGVEFDTRLYTAGTKPALLGVERKSGEEDFLNCEWDLEKGLPYFELPQD